MTIELTAPSGAVVELDPDNIDFMYPNDGSWSPKARSVVVYNGVRQAVIETTEEIDTLIQG